MELAIDNHATVFRLIGMARFILQILNFKCVLFLLIFRKTVGNPLFQGSNLCGCQLCSNLGHIT